MLSVKDFQIPSLGAATIPSPLKHTAFVEEGERVVYHTAEAKLREECPEGMLSFERAGARKTIFHDPARTKAAILTAGGLCPGLNDVIKSLTITLLTHYNVSGVYGIPYGYRGLNPANALMPMHLSADLVDNIHEQGGTILGSSRGREESSVMVDTLLGLGINILFCIGGDGTARGAHDLAQEIARRHLPISVIAIPKTVDNDISFIDQSFGFSTAVRTAGGFITGAHNEAKGAFNGVGLIKVMGRDSGFIAAYASLANPYVNYCLVPEEKFTLREGPRALLPHLEQRLARKHHAVIIVAEGAGQEFFDGVPERRDASGNKLHNDIGTFLKGEIISYFKEKGIEINLKYFDPGYSIRSVQAEGEDAVFCSLLAQCAVHAGMSGKTDMMVGHWAGEFTHVPIPLATQSRKKLDLNGPLWNGVKTLLCF